MDNTEQYKKLSDDASPLKPDYIVERIKWYEDPIYIKMCEKAEEIQRGRKITQWDYYTIDETALIFNFKPDELVGHYLLPEVWVDEVSIYNPQYIWLPRQDQLQEMLGFHSNEAMLFMFHEFTCTPLHNVVNFVWHHHKSMEQLWLAFVMKKYNKTWDGEEWKELPKEEE